MLLPQENGLAAGHALGVGKGFACSCAEPVNSHVPRVGHHAHPVPSTWHALHWPLPPLQAANGAAGAPAEEDALPLKRPRDAEGAEGGDVRGNDAGPSALHQQHRNRRRGDRKPLSGNREFGKSASG